MHDRPRSNPAAVSTQFTRMMGIDYPIVAGPMFLVTDEALVSSVSGAGGLGAMPSLNWKTSAEFRGAIHKVRAQTQKPFGVNLIVNQANTRQYPDLEICAEEKVPLVITSLGNPKEVIRHMHAVGSKVYCDVTTLEYAKKVQDLGADGVIAVGAGAGGHAGPISPLVLIPYLRENLSIPVVAAGGIAHGRQIAAALMLGASAVQIGTRFIATPQARVDSRYKNAIVDSNPEDIVLTLKVSGVPAAVIKTPYIERVGTDINFIEKLLMKNKSLKKYVSLLRHTIGARLLEKAAATPTWKEVWSAGQGVAFIDDVRDAGQVVVDLMTEYFAAVNEFCEKRGKEK